MEHENEKTNEKLETKQNAPEEKKLDGKEEIQALNDKISEQKNIIDEQDDRIKRLMAEFENFKKRSDKERTNLYNSVMGDVIIKLLPIIDNLEKASEAKTEDDGYKQGVELVLKQFKDVLAANGIQEIETVGQVFDPELHEAVASVQDETLGEKVIAQEYRKGYKIGNKVIRHSMVVVAH